jgi:hypothetical protein
MRADDFRGAIDRFEKSLAAGVHFKTLELPGECYLKVGRESCAIIALAAATALNRGVRAPSILADLLSRSDNSYHRELAVEVCKTALVRDPTNRLTRDAESRLRASRVDPAGETE